MSEPVWVRRDVLELLHSESIATHGGADGLRDEGLFESALSRPQNLFAYEGTTDVSRLAALGWTAKTPLADGVRRTYEWVLANRANPPLIETARG